MWRIANRIGNSKEARNATWIIIGKISQVILSFILSIFTTRYLGPSNFGTINYASAYVLFFTSFCSLGINSVIVKDMMDEPEEIGKAVGTSIFLRCLAGLCSSILIVLVVWLIDGNTSGTTVIAFLCSISLVFQAGETVNYWFQSRYQSKISAIASLISYFITSIYKIILLFLGKSVYWFAFATSIDYIIMAFILIVAYKSNGGPSLEVSFEKGRRLLGKSYNYILSGMMVAIYMQTDKLMLKYMLDEKSVGYYSLASSINSMWTFVLAAIIDSMYPTIINSYKEDKEKFNDKNRLLYSIVIYISLFMAFLITVAGKFAIVLLYGREFGPAYGPLKIICWYVVFSYLGVARNAWIICENQQFYLKFFYAIAAIVNVILNLLLIPRYGANGAAWASLITQISTCIILPSIIKTFRPNVKLMIEAFFLKELLPKKEKVNDDSI